MKVKKILLLAFTFALLFQQISAQTEKNVPAENHSLNKISRKNLWSKRIADSFINRYPAENIHDSVYNGKWTYDQGVVLEGLHQLWLKTHDKKYLRYIKSNVDMFIGDDGSIRTYKYKDFNIDNINTGRQLLFLFSVTKDIKYKVASDTLRKQLQNQPRTKAGGFWHKKIYPFQMWLDGLYMGEPFYAQYSKLFGEPKNFDDIAHQFTLIKKKRVTLRRGFFFTHGMKVSLRSGLTQRRDVPQTSGHAQWDGMQWLLLTYWTIFRKVTRNGKNLLEFFRTFLLP